MPAFALRMRVLAGLAMTALAAGSGWVVATKCNLNPNRKTGDVIDEFNDVKVYFNGGVNHSAGRNLSPEGYNLGIRYQCVEFAKRYYFERFGHRMPDSYGHARHFFDPEVPEGGLNPKRGLIQFWNGSGSGPRPEDILVFGPTLLNPYGHVAIVTRAMEDGIEIVQQNPGPFGRSREVVRIDRSSGRFFAPRRVRGWLRRSPQK